MPYVNQAPQSGDTRILRLFRLARTIRQAAEDHTGSWEDTETELEELFYRQARLLEDELMASPPTCAEDMAAKLLTASRDGDYCLERSHPLISEALSLTGFQRLNLAVDKPVGLAA